MIYKCTSSLRVISETLSVSELANLFNVDSEKIHEKGAARNSERDARRSDNSWINTITLESV